MDMSQNCVCPAAVIVDFSTTVHRDLSNCTGYETCGRKDMITQLYVHLMHLLQRTHKF